MHRNPARMQERLQEAGSPSVGCLEAGCFTHAVLYLGAVAQPLHWQVTLCTQRPQLLYRTSMLADSFLQADAGSSSAPYIIMFASHLQGRIL